MKSYPAFHDGQFLGYVKSRTDVVIVLQQAAAKLFPEVKDSSEFYFGAGQSDGPSGC